MEGDQHGLPVKASSALIQGAQQFCITRQKAASSKPMLHDPYCATTGHRCGRGRQAARRHHMQYTDRHAAAEVCALVQKGGQHNDIN